MQTSQPFIAIAGNPNAGKTTAFNKYTGSRQHVGNYPGITVEKKEGTASLDGRSIPLVDLPGTYSLTAYSMEEVVARKVLAEEKPGAVINIVNATVLERNLYLTVQLLEMGVPLVLALNMMDEARDQGLQINIKRLSELMQIPVVSTVARTGEGLDTALAKAVAIADTPAPQQRTGLCISYGPDIDETLLQMIPLIEEQTFLTALYPARWVALKYLEQDDDIMAKGLEANSELANSLQQIVDTCAKHVQSTLQTYPEALISDYRYGYISSVLRQGVITDEKEQRNRIAYSDSIDSVLTHRFLGPAIMFGVLYCMYMITFSVGQYPADLLTDGFAALRDSLDGIMPAGPFKSLLLSGIIDGVGGVFSFVPLILVMFFLIAALEDSGYMARIAYMVDRIFRSFGLHGASVMPFIISGGIAGGCAVPGIMAARTLRSPKERLATILTAPFMACGAKLPVFLLFVSVFFKGYETITMFCLTLTGWLAALLVARVLRSTIITGEATPFVMELPPYRMPSLWGLCIHAWERIWQYIKKAGTIIVAISILLWAAMSYPTLPASQIAEFAAAKEQTLQTLVNASSQEQSEAEATLDNAQSAAALRYSLAGKVGTALENITQPAGFDWRTNIALLGGIAAKEVVLSTLATAYSLGDVDPEEDEGQATLATRIAEDAGWTKANATALLLFTLLYSPCFVTLVVIKGETGRWRWSLFSLVFNLVFAFAVAVLANQLIALL